MPASATANEKPHSSQNFAPSLFACPQLAQTNTPTRLDHIPTHDNRGPALDALLTRLASTDRLERSPAERTRPENRRLKFYELRDMLSFRPYRAGRLGDGLNRRIDGFGHAWNLPQTAARGQRGRKLSPGPRAQRRFAHEMAETRCRDALLTGSRAREGAE